MGTLIIEPNNIMDKKKLPELTDQELLQEAKKAKSASMMNALLIGFLIGIVLYSFLTNVFGFLMLFPLFFAYKLINNSKYKNKELEDLLKERGLK